MRPMVMEIPARKPMSASRLTVACAVLVVEPIETAAPMMRSRIMHKWIYGLVLMALALSLAPAAVYAQSSDPEQQKKEQEFISEVNRKIEREFQIREKLLAEKEQKKKEELEKSRQADAARTQFSSMWGRSVPNYMFDSYTLSEPPLRKR